MGKKIKYNLNQLIGEGLIRPIPKSNQKAEESVRTAESLLKEAKNNFGSKALKSCIISSYLAMFHSARAILFANGFREKSHFAVARFLESKYAKAGLLEEKWVQMLDHSREARHDDQYSTSFIVTEQEAKSALDSAKRVIERMKELLKLRNSFR